MQKNSDTNKNILNLSTTKGKTPNYNFLTHILKSNKSVKRYTPNSKQ